VNKRERDSKHILKMVEILNSKGDGDWLERYVDFHIELYGIKESKRIARIISGVYPEFAQMVAGR